jgi:hypothetical protein
MQYITLQNRCSVQTHVAELQQCISMYFKAIGGWGKLQSPSMQQWAGVGGAAGLQGLPHKACGVALSSLIQLPEAV